MEVALEMYMYNADWRDDDERSDYSSVVYCLTELQQHETYLLSLMMHENTDEL